MNDRPLTTLPKWAQDEITGLRSQVAYWREQAAEGLGNHHPRTNVFVHDPRSDRGGYVATPFRVARFMLGDDWQHFIDCRIDTPNGRKAPPTLYLCTGYASLIIAPSVANAIHIRAEP